MNQADIVAEMRVLPDIDVEYEIRRRVDFIKYQLELSGLQTLVLGISGGIDSCTCGRLAQLAIEELNQDTSSYRFSVDDGGELRVSAELIFRRAFKELMDQKGWSDPDVIMETTTIEVPPRPLAAGPRSNDER